MTLTFSEAVAASRGFDPSQFRLSGSRIDPAGEVVEYVGDDLFLELDPDQRFSFVRIDQPTHTSLRLWPSHPIEAEFCADLDGFRLGMHFSEGAGAIVDGDGERLAEIVPYWATSGAEQLALSFPDQAQRPDSRTVVCQTGPAAQPKPPLCQGTPPEAALPRRPRIIRAEFDGQARTVELSFSEPVAEVGKLDPKQFRLSAWSEEDQAHHDAGGYVEEDRSLCDDDGDDYASEECTSDWDWSAHPQDFLRASVVAPGRVSLWLNGKVGKTACDDLADRLGTAPSGPYLHYKDRADGGLAAKDGRRVQDVSEPWVRFAPQHMDGQTTASGGPPALAVKCTP